MSSLTILTLSLLTFHQRHLSWDRQTKFSRQLRTAV